MSAPVLIYSGAVLLMPFAAYLGVKIGEGLMDWWDRRCGREPRL